jgi:serine/threonine protein kinase
VHESTDDPTGRVLGGRYEVLRALGEESLGRIWAARDRETEKLVQLKVLPPHLATDPKQFMRFAREITASFMVTHTNTVEVVDYGEQDEMHYLVLENLVAHPLADDLEGNRRLPLERACAIAAQVTLAIGAAHQEGIVHRSLCPDNIMLLDNVAPGGPVVDHVKVRDFGMSKLLDSATDGPELTAVEIRVGDPAYMSPEYIDTGRFHPKGDLYAVGVLLFRMLAGQPPFVGPRPAQISLHVTTPAPRLATRVDVPPWLDSLVSDLLVKDPESRPGVHEVVARLEAGIGHSLHAPGLLPLDAAGNVVRPPEPPAIPAESGSMVYMAVAAVSVLVFGVVGVVGLISAAAVVAFVLSLPS